MIWETAVGTMDPFPWKNPRNTPRIATIRMHGASTRKANALIFIAIRFDAIKSAPKNMMAPTIPPAAIANVMAPRKTRYAFLYCPVASLAETSLDTARGRL